MIFEIVRSLFPERNSVFIKPLYCVDAWDAYNMLNDAFPYNYNTYEGSMWQFFICCFDGYENCIEFQT